MIKSAYLDKYLFYINYNKKFLNNKINTMLLSFFFLIFNFVK